MHREVLSNNEVAELQNKTFLNVEFNSDRQPKFIEKWHIRAVPATLVLTPDGDILANMGDEYDPKVYIEKLNRARTRGEELMKLKKSAAESPNDPEPHLKLAKFYASSDPARQTQYLQGAADAYAKKGSLTDDEKKQAARTLIDLADAKISQGAAPDELGGFAARLDEYGFPANALFLRGIIAYLNGDAEGLYEKMVELRAKYADSDRDEWALVWMGYVLLEVRKDKPAAKKVYEEFLSKYKSSKVYRQMDATYRRELKDIK
jgi:tetratricopeptide (TPR) repeat protein